jgi:hypothetical protein
MEGGVILERREDWVRMVIFIGILLVPVVLSLACKQHAPDGENEIVVEAQGESSDLPECTDIINLAPGFTECEPEEVLSFDTPFVFEEGAVFNSVQCLVAELDGNEPLEAVVKLDFYLDENYQNSCITVYSYEDSCLPHLIACEVTPRASTGPSWLDAVDINGDGVDEIILVTETDETGAASEPCVYRLKDGKLLNAVRGSYSVPSFFNCSLPFETLLKNVPLKIVHERLSGRMQAVVLNKDESGFYLVTEVKPSRHKSAINLTDLIQAAVADAQNEYIMMGTPLDR